MSREQWINELNVYIDQLMQKHKDELFLTYVRSKRVELENCNVYMDKQFTVITARTKKSRHELKIWNRTPHRPNRMFSCGCHDFKYRLKKRKPCKHLFRLIERYQTKTQHIREYNNEA